MLTVGLPSEWEQFERRHQEFLGRFPVLKDACNIAFGSAHTSSLADAVVLGLGRVCAEELLEILVLCGNGYGFAATRLLRSMYERAVTARYIHGHPDQADHFVRYSAIQKGKLARVLLAQFGDGLPPERVELLERALVAADEIRDDYVRKCESCGSPHPSPSWGPDIVTMAREARILWPLLATCYYEALLHAHATLHSVETFVTRRGADDGWTFDFQQPQHRQVDNTLFHAHTILLDALNLQRERFQPEGLASALEAADQAYGRVWMPDRASPSTG